MNFATEPSAFARPRRKNLHRERRHSRRGPTIIRTAAAGSAAVGTLSNLGRHISDQTIGNIPKRDGITPAPKRSQITSRKEFISAYMAVLAGTDLFTVEVLTWRGLVPY